MPDLAIGDKLEALDYTPAAYSQDGTAINNVSTTSFTAGSPVVSVLFRANTFGKILLTVGGGARGDSSNDRIDLAPQIFLGTSSAGTEFLAPSILARGWSEGEGSIFAFGARTTYLSGLTPGATYFARVMHKSQNGVGTADIVRREIFIQATS